MLPKKSLNRSLHIFAKVFLVLCFMISIAALVSLRINQVICQQDGQECDVVNTSLADNIKQTRLCQFSSTRLGKAISTYPLNESVAIQLRLPDTAIVSISTYKHLITAQLVDTPPSLTTPSNSATPSAMIRQQAVSLINSDFQNLHAISITPTGRFINSSLTSNIMLSLDSSDLNNTKKLGQIYSFIQNLFDAGINFQRIYIASDIVTLKLASQTYVLLDQSRDLTSATASLQQLLAQSTINLEGMIIDLRFNYPVIAPINTP